MRVGYFCTGGHTETGAMDVFLRRLNPAVTWVRCFPPVAKPAPKLGRARPEPRADETGVTGDGLARKMVERLERFHRGAGAFDAVMLIDDADCRFGGAAREGYEAWLLGLTADVRAATGVTELPFIALLASPEIEGWFVADWAQTFGREACLQPIEHALHRRVRALLGEAGCEDQVEGYGCPRQAQGCTHKLSSRIQEEIAMLAPADARTPCQYSKRLQGATMLERLDPEALAERCRIYYRDAWRQIRSMGRTASP